MGKSNVLEFVSNDTLAELTGILKDDDGNVIDITGYTIKLSIGYSSPTTKTASLTDPTNGEFKFTWSAGDLVTGTWDVEIEVTDADGKVQTAQKTARGRQFTFEIAEEIA